MADVIKKSEKVLLKEKPDILLILGDTNSGLAALPAANHGIKINFGYPAENNRFVFGVDDVAKARELLE